MELQVLYPHLLPNVRLGEGEEGNILYLLESDDGWVLLNYEIPRHRKVNLILFLSCDFVFMIII